MTEKSILNLKDSIDNLCTALATTKHAVIALESRMHAAEDQLAQINEFKIDLRRLFGAIKEISGERWPDIKKSIMEDII